MARGLSVVEFAHVLSALIDEATVAREGCAEEHAPAGCAVIAPWNGFFLRKNLRLASRWWWLARWGRGWRRPV